MKILMRFKRFPKLLTQYCANFTNESSDPVIIIIIIL